MFTPQSVGKKGGGGEKKKGEGKKKTKTKKHGRFLITLGLIHIVEVYTIRYLLYAIFALRHRRHSSDVAWK